MSTEKSRLERFIGKNAKEVFTEIYNINEWGSNESKSGKGSTMDITSIIREQLPEVFKKYDIKRLYDGACGDFNWMKAIVTNLDFYTGADIVEKLIHSNRKNYANDKVNFRIRDISMNKFDKGYDAIFLRDVLVHLPNEVIIRVLDNVKKSDAKYLIATNFKDVNDNLDLPSYGLWRPVNLEIEPFNLGEPIESIHEANQRYKFNGVECTDKYLSIWEIKR